MYSRSSRSKAFTLIELLVVITIIGILAAVVVASLQGAETKAQNAHAQSDLSAMGTAISLFEVDNNNQLIRALNSSSSGGDTLTASTTTTSFTQLFSGSDPYFLAKVTSTPSKAYTYTYETTTIQDPAPAAATIIPGTTCSTTSHCQYTAATDGYLLQATLLPTTLGGTPTVTYISNGSLGTAPSGDTCTVVAPGTTTSPCSATNPATPTPTIAATTGPTAGPGGGFTGSSGLTVLSVSNTAQAGEDIDIQGGAFTGTTTAWIQLVDSDGSLDSTEQQQLPISNQSAYLIQAKIPSSMPEGLWAVWVEDEGVSSNAEYIHQAQVTGFDTDQIAANTTFHVWGRSLISPGGSYTNSYITFTSGSTKIVTPATSGDAYSLGFVAPTNLVPGTNYTLAVSNGLGGSLGLTYPTSTLTVLPSQPDILGLGVPWAGEFNFASTVYNIQTDPHFTVHGVGNGTTDNMTAIQNAINYVSGHGGGVIYFPNGTYYVNNNGRSLSFASDVVLEGQSEAGTIFTYGDQASASGYDFIRFSSGAEEGLLDLTIQDLNTSSTPNGSIVLSTGMYQFMQNITYNMGSESSSIISDGIDSHFLLADTTINDESDATAPLYIDGNDVVIRNNTVTFAVSRIKIVISNMVTIEDNQFIRTQDLTGSNHVESGGLELSFDSNLALIGNTIEVTAPTPVFTNDNEMVLTQNSVYDLSIVGTPTGATSTTLTDTTQDWSSPTAFQPYASHPQGIIAITAGPGLGQWRNIASHTATTITVDTPWNITPQSNSQYTITWWTAEDFLIENNTITNGRAGIVLYSGAYDTTIANNTLINTGDIALIGQERNTGQHFSLWDNLVVDNTVKNTTNIWPAQIYIGGMQVGPYILFNVQLDNEVRNNSVIAYSPNTSNSYYGLYDGGEGYYNTLTNQTGGGADNLLGSLGSIFDGNSAQNVSPSPVIGQGTSQISSSNN